MLVAVCWGIALDSGMSSLPPPRTRTYRLYDLPRVIDDRYRLGERHLDLWDGPRRPYCSLLNSKLLRA